MKKYIPFRKRLLAKDAEIAELQKDLYDEQHRHDQTKKNFEMMATFKMKDMIEDLQKYSAFYFETVDNRKKPT